MSESKCVMVRWWYERQVIKERAVQYEERRAQLEKNANSTSGERSYRRYLVVMMYASDVNLTIEHPNQLGYERAIICHFRLAAFPIFQQCHSHQHLSSKSGKSRRRWHKSSSYITNVHEIIAHTQAIHSAWIVKRRQNERRFHLCEAPCR